MRKSFLFMYCKTMTFWIGLSFSSRIYPVWLLRLIFKIFWRWPMLVFCTTILQVYLENLILFYQIKVHNWMRQQAVEAVAYFKVTWGSLLGNAWSSCGLIQPLWGWKGTFVFVSYFPAQCFGVLVVWFGLYWTTYYLSCGETRSILRIWGSRFQDLWKIWQVI
jgi:hypothetical protein